MATNIQKSAVIVRLEISQWGGEKIDRSVSDEVANNKNASSKAGKYVKSLFADNEMLKEIKKVAGKARNLNKELTLPYAKGQDLMPVTMFDFHKEKIGNLKDIFDGLVEDFLKKYERHRDRQQGRLGEMFNADDYPSVEAVREKFSMTINYEPLADNNMFDKMFGSEELEQQLIENAETQMQSRIDGAMHDLWERLISRVELFHHKMVNYKPAVKGESKVVDGFKDSLVENIRDLCQVLPRLNLTGDADLNNYCELVKQKLAVLDAGDLRENEVARKSAANEAQGILDAMAGYGVAA
jgi:hypothetical protein|tara:strand:+ start:1275 stop:2165 length:891 start_codon:yes stop_codon:yes gene_type:complete